MKSGNSRIDKKKIFNLLYVLPLLLVFMLFIAYPIFDVFRLSVFNKLLNGKMVFIGLKNFETFFKDRNTVTILLNTFIWVFVGVFFKLLLGLIIALVLNKEFPGKKIMTGVLLIPWAMPVAIACITWRWIYNPTYGYFNSILTFFGLPSDTNWLGSTTFALAAVILVNVWAVAPFCGLNLLSALYGIPNSLYEASQIDGANSWLSFWNITFPLLTPTLKTLGLLIGIWGFNSFDVIFMLTEGGPLYSTEIMVSSIYKQAFVYNKMGYASAIAVVCFIMLSIFSIVYIKSRKEVATYE